MTVTIDTSACTGCETCIDECSLELLSLQGGVVVISDPDECLDCGRCVDVCPNDALSA